MELYIISNFLKLCCKILKIGPYFDWKLVP